jgi:flagellar motor component MotA
VGVFFAHQYGFFHELQNADKSYLGFVIMAILAAMTMWIGRLTYKMDKTGLNFGWLVSDQVLTIGMIGTVVGFIMILGSGFNNYDANNAKELMNKIGDGLGTALYTTLMGLVSSALLKLQLFNLTNALDAKQEEQVHAKSNPMPKAPLPRKKK